MLLVAAATHGHAHLHASVELLQEFLFHRLRRTARAVAIRQTRDVQSLCTMHSFDQDIADRMLDLMEGTPIRGRDAVHAATAIAAGFGEIVSADADLAVPGLDVIPPEAVLLA